MTAGVEIDLHAPLAHGTITLRTPRTAGLSVARRRLAENALDIGPPRPLAPIELAHAFVPAELRQIQGGTGLDAVPIGVITDLMFLQCRDRVRSLAPLQRSRFLANHLESRAHSFAAEEVRHMQRRVVTGRQEVILRVEPENHVDLRRRFRRACGGRWQPGDKEQQQGAPAIHSDGHEYFPPLPCHQQRRAASSMAAASCRVVSPRASPRNMLANSSKRSASSSNSICVTVRLPRRDLRMVQ